LRDRAALGALLWPTGDADAQGYEEIETRAASAYEHWVGSEGLSFRGRDDAERLGDVVKFHWEAVAKDGGAFAAAAQTTCWSRWRAGRDVRRRVQGVAEAEVLPGEGVQSDPDHGADAGPGARPADR
jgi:hypothetical protein